MKNNKGMTLVEIIISIALISIVLLFLFMLLITVNDINDESEVNSTYLINKSLILKNIEEDLSKASSVKLNKCKISDFYTSYKDSLETKYKANQCISIAYLDEDNNLIGEKPAYIGIYYYQNKSSYVISYIRGNIKATRLLTDFEKYNVNQSTGELKSDSFKIKYTNANNSTTTYDNLDTVETLTTGFQKITIPIIGPDEKDYSIIISYYGKVTIE